MKFITLTEQKYSFDRALRILLSGRVLGIRPENNTGFIKLYKPHWMNNKSPDHLLCWTNGNKDKDGCAEIRTNQYLEDWYLVVSDEMIEQIIERDCLKAILNRGDAAEVELDIRHDYGELAEIILKFLREGDKDGQSN